MSAKTMDDLMDKICDEIEEVSQKISREGKISVSDLQKVGELIDIKKNILKVEKLEDSAGYSQAGDWEAMGRGHFGDVYSRNGRYDEGGNSYRGQRRDSMGRYSREGRGGDYFRNHSGRGYSRDGGKEDMMEHVEMLMDVASTPEEREAVKRFKKQLENM